MYTLHSVRTSFDYMNFDFNRFSSILDDARKKSNKRTYCCCMPNCNENALSHSHIIPQSTLKKYICDNKNRVIQCQIDEIHPMSILKTEEMPLEKIDSIGISNAMSMPLFCKKHDNDLFCRYEKDADNAAPNEARFQTLQALRAICALKYRDTKMLVQNEIKSTSDDFYIGGVYEIERQVYEYLVQRDDSTISSLCQSLDSNDFSSYEFICIELELIKLAICDVYIDDSCLEDEESTGPLNALFINCIPKDNHSYLTLGYDKRYVSDKQKEMIVKWGSVLDKGVDIKTIYDILCHCGNNWCISPDCDNRIIEYIKTHYSEDRMEVILQ